jgi:hypothetical protein
VGFRGSGATLARRQFHCAIKRVTEQRCRRTRQLGGERPAMTHRCEPTELNAGADVGLIARLLHTLKLRLAAARRGSLAAFDPCHCQTKQKLFQFGGWNTERLRDLGSVHAFLVQ